MNRYAMAACLIALSLASAYGQKSADIEKAIRTLDDQWCADFGAKDLDKTVSYYAEGALVMPPNDTSATTSAAIREAWKALLTAPGVAFSWKTTKVEVAQSGDLAYSTGTYDLTMNDAAGKPMKEKGKYVEIWKKQVDGKWKVVADIWNSDLPAAPPEKK